MKIPFLKSKHEKPDAIPEQSQSTESLSGSVIVLYSMPVFSAGMLNYLVMQYYMKYATDILLIAPGIIGTIFLISRIWDAVNDPIVGHLSDRTRSSAGRRIPWIFYSILPTVAFFSALWFVPGTATSLIKIAIITIAMLGFFTSITAIFIPHYSLGSELSSDYQERNKVFGIRAVFENIGNIAGVIIMSVMIQMESRSMIILIPVVAALAIVINSFIIGLKKKADLNSITPETGSSIPFFRSAKSALSNPQAVIIYTTGFFSQMGATFILIMTLYYAEYVLMTKNLAGIYIAIFMISAIVSIFMWIYISRFYTKRKLWMVINILLAFGFLATMVMSPHTYWLMFLFSSILGTLAGGSLVLNPSMLADSIKPDKAKNGEKSNEGVYFSFFTFVNKSSMGLSAALTGLVLELANFIPNQVQSGATITKLSFFYGIFPFFFFLSAAFFLYFYKEGKN